MIMDEDMKPVCILNMLLGTAIMIMSVSNSFLMFILGDVTFCMGFWGFFNIIKSEAMASEKGESKRIAVKCNTKLCDPPEKAKSKIPKESEWEYTGRDK